MVAKRHIRQGKAKLNNKRFKLAFIPRVELFFVELVLKNVFIDAEIVINIFVYNLHLFGINDERLAINLLDVRIFCVNKENAARVFGGKVFFAKTCAFFSDCRILQRLRKLRNETQRRAVLDSLNNALILNVNQFQRRVNNARVAVAEEVVLELHLRQYARVFQFNRCALTVREHITQIRFSLNLNDFDAFRAKGIIPGYRLIVRPVKRHNKRVVRRRVNGRSPIKELRRIHIRVWSV